MTLSLKIKSEKPAIDLAKSPNGWWDLSPAWDMIYEIGQRRHVQKDEFKSTRAWHIKSHIIGIVGEFVVSLESGKEFDSELRLFGDGGRDFEINNEKADIKCATFIKDPDLKHPANEHRWPDYFVLVAFNEPNKKARLMGWTTGDLLKIADIRDYGYGPQRIMNWRKLKDGLPPIFGEIK